VESINPTNPSLDYAPCSHSNGDVVCDQVPLEDVQRVFNQTSSPRLASIKLTLQPYIFSETFIPEDVFGSKRILDILIQFPNEAKVNRSLSLEVDPNAFRSTKSYTEIIRIYYIDCTLLDLGFLSGFDKLTLLDFGNIYNIQHCLPTLPPLPRLTTLYIAFCTGMNELNSLPTLINGLKVFDFKGDVHDIHKSYNDKIVDQIMDWLLLWSANTLEDLSVTYMNQVTRVPHKISSLESLRRVWLHSNNIPTIKSGELSFSSPVVSFLDISRNGIKEIEPSAFQGIKIIIFSM